MNFGIPKSGGGTLSRGRKKSKEVFHQPVLLKEAIEFLKVKRGEKYIDATVGGGGHTVEILKRGGRVLGLDVDPEAIGATKEKIRGLDKWTSRKSGNSLIFQSSAHLLILHKGNFAHLREIALKLGFDEVAGILFDLGVSARQLLTPERGFSFTSDAPLDMRMDPDLAVTAADLVNGLGRKELYELFSKLGEEHHAWRIARAIVSARSLKPIKTCAELARIIMEAVPRRRRSSRINPATRCFQALRIAVNDELNNLNLALPQAIDLLKPGGRLVVVSFHSLEDRIVKNFLKEREGLKILTKKPIRPTETEVKRNPRSRSAKMRVGEKKG